MLDLFVYFFTNYNEWNRKQNRIKNAGIILAILLTIEIYMRQMLVSQSNRMLIFCSDNTAENKNNYTMLRSTTTKLSTMSRA